MPLPHLPARFRPSTLAVCLHGALCLALLPSSAFAQAPAAADAGARAYRIVAGPLDDALNRFARQAGITLSFTPQQVDGLRGMPLRLALDGAARPPLKQRAGLLLAVIVS